MTVANLRPSRGTGRPRHRQAHHVHDLHAPASCPQAKLSDVEEGDRATLTSPAIITSRSPCAWSVWAKTRQAPRLLVLSSDRALQNVTLLRQQSAEIVFTSYAGLRVPKSAVRVENGQTGVYIPRRDARQVEAHHHSPRYRRKLCRHARHQLDQQPLAGRRADYQREKIYTMERSSTDMSTIAENIAGIRSQMAEAAKKPDATRPKFCCAPRRR